MFGIDKTLPIVDFSNFDVSQFGDALVFGGAVLLIGMATVFAVLCILWAFLGLFKLVFHDIPKKKSEKSVKSVDLTEQAPQTVVSDANEEIVAVIAAAIAAAESDNTGIKFKVVSFRKV